MINIELETFKNKNILSTIKVDTITLYVVKNTNNISTNNIKKNIKKKNNNWPRYFIV